MLVNNYLEVKRFLKQQFDNTNADGFYKFEAIIRKKDNPDNCLVKYTDGSYLVRAWVVDSLEAFEKRWNDMVYLCDVTGARLYMSTNMKSKEKLVYALLDSATELIKGKCRGNIISIKNVFNLMNSLTSRDGSSVHEAKTFLFDIDTKEQTPLLELYSTVEGKVDYLFTFQTLNGNHLVTPTFNKQEIADLLDKYKDVIELKQNALTLAYYNKKEV